ncbi:MAG: TonB-dependent siderophore receptor, partial [Opitutales bacterium]
MYFPSTRLPASASLALAFVFAASSLRAQTAPAPAPQPALQQVEIMSPFDVNAAQEHGYEASEATTGTRIATKIIDTPFAVDVVTKAFMNDFMTFDLNEQLALVPGFSPSEVFGNFQLRGFTSPVVFIDGFRHVGLIDTVAIDRIEVIKGSAASIYGAIQPGGAVNVITLKPTATPAQELTLGGGGEDFRRVALSSSGPMGPSGKLFYRVDAADVSNMFGQNFAKREKSYVAGQLLYKPGEDTSFNVSFDHGELFEHPFTQVLTITEKQTMPWAGNSVTESQYYGLATAGSLYDYNYGGPQSVNHNRLTSGTLTLEHRFNTAWSMRLGASLYTNAYDDQLIGSGAYYPYGTGNVTVVNGAVTNPFTPEVKDQPQADWKPQRGGGAQLDNLFQFTTGPISNKLLVTLDYYAVNQRTKTLAPTVNGSVATDYYATVSPYNAAGASYYTMQTTWSPALGYGWNTTTYAQNPALYNFASTDNTTISKDAGLFVSYWASALNDRLKVMVGGRFDRVTNDVSNYNISSAGVVDSAANTTEPASFQAFSYNTQAWTYQVGASFKLTNNINLYANKSTAFNPQPQL